MRNTKKELGLIAENFASSLLVENGYRIICRNYRNCFGEVDIIALYQDTLVFVEVKFRNNHKFGLPEEAVTRRKLERIINVGCLFWKDNFPNIKKARVDIVAVEKDGENLRGRIIGNVFL